jgi:hypothetical protein
MAKFAFNNIVHSSTQQTHLFANNDLHFKFNIQGVHKVMNPIVKDRVMWLANVWAQLVLNLKYAQRRYKENANEYWKEQPSFKVED